MAIRTHPDSVRIFRSPAEVRLKRRSGVKLFLGGLSWETSEGSFLASNRRQ